MPAKPEWVAWCKEADLQVDGSSIEVPLPDGRRHRITVFGEDASYQLVARVARVSQLLSVENIHVEMWLKNRTLSLVGFDLDRRGNLIGRVRFPRAGLDADEFRFYVRILAAECDRLEALMTGLDES